MHKKTEKNLFNRNKVLYLQCIYEKTTRHNDSRIKTNALE